MNATNSGGIFSFIRSLLKVVMSGNASMSREGAFHKARNEEAARFRGFLRDTGRKAGPWVRTLVLAGLDREGAPAGAAVAGEGGQG